MNVTKEELLEVAQEIHSAILEELLELADTATVMKLVERFGGDCIYFPKLSSIVTSCKRQQIIKDFRAGKPVKKIARLYGYSPRYVYRLVSECRGNEGQGHEGQ